MQQHHSASAMNVDEAAARELEESAAHLPAKRRHRDSRSYPEERQELREGEEEDMPQIISPHQQLERLSHSPKKKRRRVEDEEAGEEVAEALERAVFDEAEPPYRARQPQQPENGSRPSVMPRRPTLEAAEVVDVALEVIMVDMTVVDRNHGVVGRWIGLAGRDVASPYLSRRSRSDDRTWSTSTEESFR